MAKTAAAAVAFVRWLAAVPTDGRNGSETVWLGEVVRRARQVIEQ